MPLETQPIGLETKTFILLYGYKLNSRQELVNVPLEEKKTKTIRYYMIKRVKKGGEGEVVVLDNYMEAGQYHMVEIALTLNTALVSYQGSVNNELCDLGGSA